MKTPLESKIMAAVYIVLVIAFIYIGTLQSPTRLMQSSNNFLSVPIYLVNHLHSYCR